VKKGTASSESERSALRLHGLLPAAIEQQCVRAYDGYRRKGNDLAQEAVRAGMAPAEGESAIRHRLQQSTWLPESRAPFRWTDRPPPRAAWGGRPILQPPR